MTVWVALLRAVNVSGVNSLPMGAFRDLLTGLGLADVRTYIQSGNAVFRSDLTGEVLRARIADGVLAKFGFRPPVLMLSADEIAAALAACSFGEQPGDKVHFFFTERALPRATAEFLKSVAAPSEEYAWRDKVLWLHLPEGIGRSKLARRVMGLPIDTTARNLRSVRAIVALTQKVGAA